MKYTKKRRIFLITFILFASMVVIDTYMLNFGFNIFKDNDDNKIELHSKDIILPEDVKLDIIVPEDIVTRKSVDFSVIGQPDDSYVYWFLDDVSIGEGYSIEYTFNMSAVYNLTTSVQWNKYSVNSCKILTVKTMDIIASFLFNNDYAMKEEDSRNVFNFIQIDPSLTDPVGYINFTFYNGSGIVTLRVMSKEEYGLSSSGFLYGVKWNMSWGNCSRSFFLNRTFFKNNRGREPYFICVDIDLKDNDPSDEKEAFLFFDLYCFIQGVA